MMRTKEPLFPQKDLDFSSRESGANGLVRAVEVTVREFHESGDLFVLQQRCEALVQMLEADDQPGKAAVDWVATQAELIDCGLLTDSNESLEQVLQNLLGRASTS
jgi:isopentenyl diphosphate isomerase/L-lactate dehydrogenase-like FMN-dependent dehydrogenase